MTNIFLKSLSFSLLAAVLTYSSRSFFQTQTYLSDIGGIQSFLGVFGTLYGIMAAFVVFEVWNEYNSSQSLIEREAVGLEKLYHLTLYFRDNKLKEKMKKVIVKYVQLTVESFPDLALGKRNNPL